MKKKDYIVIIGVLLVAVMIWIGFGQLWKSDGSIVEVTVDGEVLGTYRLDQDQTVQIQKTNVLVIENGKADMTDANCPDQLCVHQKAISKSGETIVCLPNKVIVTIIGAEESAEDVVVQ